MTWSLVLKGRCAISGVVNARKKENTRELGAGISSPRFFSAIPSPLRHEAVIHHATVLPAQATETSEILPTLPTLRSCGHCLLLLLVLLYCQRRTHCGVVMGWTRR